MMNIEEQLEFDMAIFKVSDGIEVYDGFDRLLMFKDNYGYTEWYVYDDTVKMAHYHNSDGTTWAKKFS